MKKILATVLAGVIALGMASMAFGAQKLTVTNPGDTTENYFTINGLLTSNVNRSEINVEDYYLYTQKSDDMIFKFQVGNNERLRADVTDGKISVSARRETGNTYKITVKPKFGVRDFDLQSWKVELDVGNKTYFIKGKGAYSDTQTVNSGDRLWVRDSKTGDASGNTGYIFEFDEVLDEETRLRCHDYVDVFFKGNYGTDKENMRVVTDEISEVSKFFGDIDLDFYDFIGTPKFATKVKVVIDADPNSVLYSYNKKTGDLTRVDADYESDGWAFTAKTLGTYVLAEEEYDAGNTKAE
ncbi:MAG: hypothetical protein HFG27_06660 [Provencibacterium sp.]|jgi:hypothetical protein|nr:hypothetical protein [Provencibacterium sp.]